MTRPLVICRAGDGTRRSGHVCQEAVALRATHLCRGAQRPFCVLHRSKHSKWCMVTCTSVYCITLEQVMGYELVLKPAAVRQEQQTGARYSRLRALSIAQAAAHTNRRTMFIISSARGRAKRLISQNLSTCGTISGPSKTTRMLSDVERRDGHWPSPSGRCKTRSS